MKAHEILARQHRLRAQLAACTRQQLVLFARGTGVCPLSAQFIVRLRAERRRS